MSKDIADYYTNSNTINQLDRIDTDHYTQQQLNTPLFQLHREQLTR